ncbi:hypothetical protein COBT_001329 [Conglomerata obtusa]
MFSISIYACLILHTVLIFATKRSCNKLLYDNLSHGISQRENSNDNLHENQDSISDDESRFTNSKKRRFENQRKDIISATNLRSELSKKIGDVRSSIDNKPIVACEEKDVREIRMDCSTTRECIIRMKNYLLKHNKLFTHMNVLWAITSASFFICNSCKVYLPNDIFRIEYKNIQSIPFKQSSNLSDEHAINIYKKIIDEYIKILVLYYDLEYYINENGTVKFEYSILSKYDEKLFHHQLTNDYIKYISKSYDITEETSIKVKYIGQVFLNCIGTLKNVTFNFKQNFTNEYIFSKKECYAINGLFLMCNKVIDCLYSRIHKGEVYDLMFNGYRTTITFTPATIINLPENELANLVQHLADLKEKNNIDSMTLYNHAFIAKLEMFLANEKNNAHDFFTAGPAALNTAFYYLETQHDFNPIHFNYTSLDNLYEYIYSLPIRPQCFDF